MKSLLSTLDPDQRKVFSAIFDEVLGRFSLGDATKATNAAWYRVTGTTAAVANTEFSIAHGMDVPPALLIPAVDLTAIGSQLVPVTVTRAPDARRIYLSSPTTSATLIVYAE